VAVGGGETRATIAREFEEGLAACWRTGESSRGTIIATK